MASKYDLVALDLDGTLLRSDRRICPRAIRALKRCALRGTRIVIATARPPRNSTPYYRQLQLGTVQINYNGGLVCDPGHGTVAYHRPIETEVAIEALQFARRTYPPVNVAGELMDRLYVDRLDRPYVSQGERGLRPIAVGAPESWLIRPFTKLMLSGPPEQARLLCRRMERHFEERLTIFMVDEDVIQITHRLATKGVALGMVARHYGVPRERVLAVGDAANDVGMLLWAGFSVAMDNAHPMVKESADTICANNDAQGVALVLEHYILGA